MEASSNVSPISQFFTIQNPVGSSAPIKIQTLIYSCLTGIEDVLAPPTIVALHYWGGSASTFHHVPAILRQRQKSQSPHRTASTSISISHRGWGLSSAAVPDSPSAYSISALASDVVNLLPQFQTQGLIPRSGYVLCGHSMGGKVAMAVSQIITPALPRDFPPLRATLLLAPASPTPLVLPVDMREQQIHAYDSAEEVEFTIRNVLSASNGDRLHGGPDDFKMIVRDSLRGSEGAKKGWPFIAMAEDIGIREIDRDHRGFRTRVLVSRGDRVETVDRVVRETVETLRAKGHSVQLRVLEGNDDQGGDNEDEEKQKQKKKKNFEVGVGHLLPLEAPEVVADELMGILLDLDGDDRDR